MLGFRKKRDTHPPLDPLDQPILYFGENDPFSVRDSFEGVHIFGGIGSGKTSGSGATLARAFLNAGYVGLVLTAKPDEPNLWRKYARETGRKNDLIFFGPRHSEQFNALEYEARHSHATAGVTENLVQLFETLGQIDERTSGGNGGGENATYWRNQLRLLVRNSIDALRLSDLEISFANLQNLVASAPRDIAELDEATWQDESFCFEAIDLMGLRRESDQISLDDDSSFEGCWNYWTSVYPSMEERARSSVQGSFFGMCDRFTRGVLFDLFSQYTTLSPEDSVKGKIIILDLPQKQYNEVGVLAQVLFKYCWQRAIERRKSYQDSTPVFLWADEAQHFLNEHDVGFQTTSRSSQVATVYLSQNIPNYLYALGGDNRAKSLVDSLLGNLSTKIFHNNNCVETNRYAAYLFGQDYVDTQSRSFNLGGKKESRTMALAHRNSSASPLSPANLHGCAKVAPPTILLSKVSFTKAARFLAHPAKTPSSSSFNNSSNTSSMLDQPFPHKDKDVLENTNKAVYSIANSANVFVPTEGIIAGARMGNAIGQLFNITALLFARSIIAPCEFLLRGKFGERYFSPLVMIVSTLMVIFLISMGGSAKTLGIGLAVILVAGDGINGYRCFLRDRVGDYWHSYSDGESRIRFPKAEELLAKFFFTIDLSKMILEPLVLLVVSGILFAVLDAGRFYIMGERMELNIFGTYFLLAAVASFLYHLYSWQTRRKEQLDKQDANILLQVENEAAKAVSASPRKLQRKAGVAFLPPAPNES